MEITPAEFVTEYALQVVAVGQLDAQQLIAGLRCPPGYDPAPMQIVPVLLHQPASIAQAPRAVSAVCLVWRRVVPVSLASAAVAR